MQGEWLISCAGQGPACFLDESEIAMFKLSFLDRLQPLFNLIAGVQPQRSLPRAFFERAPWQTNRDLLALPAAWRRGRRVG